MNEEHKSYFVNNPNAQPTEGASQPAEAQPMPEQAPVALAIDAQPAAPQPMPEQAPVAPAIDAQPVAAQPMPEQAPVAPAIDAQPVAPQPTPEQTPVAPVIDAQPVAAQPMPEQTPVAPAQPIPSATPAAASVEKPKKKPNFKLFGIIGGVLVVIIILVIILGGKGSNSSGGTDVTAGKGEKVLLCRQGTSGSNGKMLTEGSKKYVIKQGEITKIVTWSKDYINNPSSSVTDEVAEQAIENLKTACDDYNSSDCKITYNHRKKQYFEYEITLSGDALTEANSGKENLSIEEIAEKIENTTEMSVYDCELK